MGTINQSFYDAQSTRRYPLDDNATGMADRPPAWPVGKPVPRLPDDVLVDCRLTWPQAAGQYAFVAGVTVTPKIVTVLILATNDIDSSTGVTPLAALSVAQPVAAGVHLAVTPLYAGTAGFLVLGDVTKQVTVRFSTPRQGLLLPQIAHPYAPLPIPGIQKQGNAVLLQDGVVLEAGTDMALTEETLEIDGVMRNAIVFGLVGDTPGRPTLAQYVGPCGDRPESLTCGDVGIETINGVGPDCGGNITIKIRNMSAGEFVGCGSEGSDGDAGMTLDQPVNLSDVCDNTPTLRRYVAQNQFHSSQSVPFIIFGEEFIPATELPSTGAPIADDFASGLARWRAVAGAWSPMTLAGDPTLRSVVLSHDQSTRGVLVRPDSSVLMPPCRFSVNVRLAQGPRRNAGLIFGYREDLALPVYFQLTLDQDTDRLRLQRFNGAGFVDEVTAPLPAMPNKSWCTLSITVTPGGAGVLISGSLAVATSPPTTVTTTTSLSRYGVGTLCGIGTDRSEAFFSGFLAEELS